MLQVDELGLDNCYEITVTIIAVNEMGNSTPEVFNITCDDPVNIISGEYVIPYSYAYRNLRGIKFSMICPWETFHK